MNGTRGKAEKALRGVAPALEVRTFDIFTLFRTVQKLTCLSQKKLLDQAGGRHLPRIEERFTKKSGCVWSVARGVSR